MTPDEPNETAELRRRLEQAAEGLVYSSESDRPFEYVIFPRISITPVLTWDRFAEVIGAPLGTATGERSLDEFFARHIERSDPYDERAQAIRPRYEALRSTLRDRLRDARVFRVGTIEVRCYVVGWDEHANLVGLATTAIET